MTKWEYLVLRNTTQKIIINRGIQLAEVVNSGSTPELLASLGDEGWELVGITRIDADADQHMVAFTQYIFKRPLPIEIRLQPPEPRPAAHSHGFIELIKS